MVGSRALARRAFEERQDQVNDAEPLGPPTEGGSRAMPPPSVSRPVTAPRQLAVTDQRPASGAVVAIAWILTVLTFGYFLPWAIAATRGKSNQAAIGLINLLLGWTLIGWIVALVMACTAHQVVGSTSQSTYVVMNAPGAGVVPPIPAGWYPSPDGPGQRYWDGAAWTEHRAP